MKIQVFNDFTTYKMPNCYYFFKWKFLFLPERTKYLPKFYSK